MYVEDLRAATEYYRDVLGFAVIRELSSANVEFETGGPLLVLHQGARHTAASPAPFPVSECQTCRLEARRVRTVSALQEVPHGWIYFFADSEGNVVQLYQPKALA
jgi:predicted enzyme related to lactoylglutathione lyase